MSEFRRNKKYTDTEKQEIIAYAQKHGIQTVKEKFNVWPENVRYWLASKKVKQEISEKGKERHQKTKLDKEVQKRNKEYREYRKLQGITPKKWKEWYEGLTAEARVKLNENVKQHRHDNRAHYLIKSKSRYLEDKTKGVFRRKYNEDPLYKLRCNIREHVRQAVKYSDVSLTHPSIKYLGCSIEEFRVHIESQFVEGMTWDNHGRGDHCWHLDHIKPLAMLKEVSNMDLLKEICHHSNYQPLWERDNLSKQAKYEV